MSEDFVPWSELGDDDSVDALLGVVADALQENDSPTKNSTPTEMVNDLVSNVFDARGETGILGHFIFAGEVLDADGSFNLMVVTSDNLPEWVARGMVLATDDYIAGGALYDCGEG
tara:strand:+ start:175 stop:519 length:345 start_codon:yes stop_codon:yes gene_type:complete